MLNTLALLYFVALMAFATFSDLLTMRISNRIILALVAGFAVLAVIIGLPWEQVMTHVITAAVVLVVMFTFFALGWIGGGDAKFTAATALWFGFPLTLSYIAMATVLGGVLTLAILMLRWRNLPVRLINVEWIARLHDKSSGVPYGIALAVAGLMTYPSSIISLHFSV